MLVQSIQSYEAALEEEAVERDASEAEEGSDGPEGEEDDHMSDAEEPE